MTMDMIQQAVYVAVYLIAQLRGWETRGGTNYGGYVYCGMSLEHKDCLKIGEVSNGRLLARVGETCDESKRKFAQPTSNRFASEAFMRFLCHSMGMQRKKVRVRARKGKILRSCTDTFLLGSLDFGETISNLEHQLTNCPLGSATAAIQQQQQAAATAVSGRLELS